MEVGKESIVVSNFLLFLVRFQSSIKISLCFHSYSMLGLVGIFKSHGFTPPFVFAYTTKLYL